MAYRTEKTEIGLDIVIDGWNDGVRDNPYEGIYDMRNCDAVTIPGEVSVAMSTQLTTNNLSLSNITTTLTGSVPTLAIGDNYGGGKVAYILQAGDPGYINDGTQRGFVVSSVNVSSGVYWHATNTGVTGATGTALGTGLANTNAIIALYGAESNAALVAQNYNGGGFNDWYLPSSGELNKAYINMAVLGISASQDIWTSTEVSATNAYIISFGGIGLTSVSKNNATFQVRAFRSFTNTTLTYSTFNYANASALPLNTAITFSNVGGALPTGISANTVYYILSKTSTTFTISATAGGTIIQATDAGSGTTSFSVIDVGIPIQILEAAAPAEYQFMLDNNGRVWVYDTSLLGGTYTWIYLSNLVSEGTVAETGSIIFYKGYLFLLSSQTTFVGYIKLGTLNFMSTHSNWVLNWQVGLNTSKSHYALVSINDDSVYFCNGNYVGTIFQKPNKVFDPTDATTYTYTPKILPLPVLDQATCLAELGSNLMIGGVNNYIYPWDRISPNFTTPIFLSENYTTRMVTINTTMYIFAGYKGRIFITNGANATPFYKIPEYLSNTTNPYITWTDATFNRNQLYFGFKVSDNAGVTINTCGGLWAIDVDSVSPVSPRLQNMMSYGTYNGYVSAVSQYRGTSQTTKLYSDGYGLLIGWYSGTSGGIDKGISTPYTAGQSFVDCDPVPIGQYLTNKTIQGIEYKLSIPLVAGESVTLGYRTQISGAFTDNPLNTYVAGSLSQWGSPKFQKSQWLQLQLILTSTATNPSFCRVREVRIHLQ